MDVFVELDVVSDNNSNNEQIRSVLYNVVVEGAIASYVTSVQGFDFRQLGIGKTSIRTSVYTREVTDSAKECALSKVVYSTGSLRFPLVSRTSPSRGHFSGARFVVCHARCMVL